MTYKMHKLKYFKLIACFATIQIGAQAELRISTPQMPLNTEMIKGYIDNLRNNVLNYSTAAATNANVIGSPYINDAFLKATVEGQDLPFNIRYNNYSDKMEFMQDDKIFDLNSPDNLVYYFPASKFYLQKLKYDLDGKIYDGYLYRLDKGKNYILYKREKILLKYDEGANNSYVDHSKIRFNKQNPEYILFYNDQYHLLPRKRKNIISLLKLETKSNNNSKDNLRTDEDYIKLFREPEAT